MNAGTICLSVVLSCLPGLSSLVAAGPTRKVRWVAAQSRQFFTEAKKSGQPFFYYVNYFDPHGPYTPNISRVEGLPEKPLSADDIEPLPLKAKTLEARKQVTAIIYNTILRMDAGVGLLLDELKAAGLTENTLVIFLGDNGATVPMWPWCRRVDWNCSNEEN